VVGVEIFAQSFEIRSRSQGTYFGFLTLECFIAQAAQNEMVTNFFLLNFKFYKNELGSTLVDLSESLNSKL
jgi:hypothetical protein